MSCEVCGKTEQLKTCAKCLRANYCCREHQIAHWQTHRQWCAAVVAENNNIANMMLQDNNNDNNNQNNVMSNMMLQNDQQLNDLGGGYYNNNNNDNDNNGDQNNQQMNYMLSADLSQGMNDPYQNILDQQQDNSQQQEQQNIGNYSSIPETVSRLFLLPTHQITH